MRYWLTINDSVPEEQARAIWDDIKRFEPNMTVLYDKIYVYGDARPENVSKIAETIENAGLKVERE